MKYECIRECRVCGLRFDVIEYIDVCPRCGWLEGFDFDDPDEEYNEPNLMTRKEAKELYAKGLTKFGDPIDYEEN